MRDIKKEAAEKIINAKKIVALTGAGISTNAGIPDFRGKNGIYTLGTYDPYKTFDINYFKTDPTHFFRFASSFCNLVEHSEPTKMHLFLAELESIGKEVTVITQNIDMLHERAGNKRVLNLHGSMKNGYCMNCDKLYDFDEMKEMLASFGELKCVECGGLVKPDVVFFGEPVKYLAESVKAVGESDLILILGTSLKISPANLLPAYARKGASKIIVNKGKTDFFGENTIRIEEDLDSVADYFRMEVINENTGA